MSNPKKSFCKFLTVSLVLIVFFGFPIFAAGQFSVVSTVPQDGDSNVDTSVTFQLSFSEPIDTNILFDYPPGFFINLLLYPDSLTGEPDSISVSPDMKTVYVYHLHLWPDTKYMLLINKAFSATGEPLAKPYLVTFTTGSSLPTATVSGAIFSPANEAAGTAVMLMNAPLFSDDESATESGTIVQLADGGYTIQYVPPGVYWPTSVNNFKINSDGDIEPDVSSELGFYDPDEDGVPDSIYVSEGQQLTGINILMFSLAPVTARFNFPAVSDSAVNWASDAKLVQLGTQDISAEGNAMMWMYAFYSSSHSSFRGWMCMGTLILPIPLDSSRQDTTALPDNWLDSDVIADSAEANGGDGFLNQYPDARMQAFLGTNLIRQSAMASIKKDQPISRSFFSLPFKAEGMINRLQSEADERLLLQKKPTIQNDQAMWGFSYYSDSSGNGLFLLFDAVTGEVIQPPQPAATTAKFNLAAAEQVAQNWLAEAELVMIGTHQSNLSPAGEAEMWFYVFYSASLDSEQVFFFSNGNFFGQGPIWEPPSKMALPDNWIDSDTAMVSAEANGGSHYRATNQEVWVEGGISRGLLQGQPERVVWQFRYYSNTADPLNIFIDAISGEFIAPPSLNITAQVRLQEVNKQAQIWAADFALVFIGSVAPIVPDGTCFAWAYVYYSPTKDSLRVFYAGAQGPINSEVPSNPPPSLLALPENWIDSNIAVGIVEANDGNFRVQHPDAFIAAMLSCGLLSNEVSRALWQITYFSAADTAILIRKIDALTGEIITGLKEGNQLTEVPSQFALQQNYPNPFNPETVIEYQLARASQVEVSIFNLQGQKVATLLIGHRTAGTHRVIWNGTDESGRPVASGVYLYQLKVVDPASGGTGQFVQVKKMLVMH